MRFGVIGTNFVTDWLLNAGKLCEDFELTTIYSRSLERASEYAKIHGAPYFTNSLAELAGSANVDAVYIASPTALHYSHALQMIAGGKHVLCEKPFTSNLRELQNLLDLAREREVSIMEGVRPAFVPGLGKLRELMDEIGTIRRATISLCKYSSRYDSFLAGEPSNAFNPKLSNGALMDIGVYCIHVMLRLFGVPVSTQSCCAKLENGIDCAGSILADYGDKVVDIKYSKVSDDYQFCEIQGEGGSIYFKDAITLSKIKIARRGEAAPRAVEFSTLEHDMAYELSQFIRLAVSPQAFTEQNRYSIEVMRILDETRKQCGIVFPADSES